VTSQDRDANLLAEAPMRPQSQSDLLGEPGHASDARSRCVVRAVQRVDGDNSGSCEVGEPGAVGVDLSEDGRVGGLLGDPVPTTPSTILSLSRL